MTGSYISLIFNFGAFQPLTSFQTRFLVSVPRCLLTAVPFLSFSGPKFQVCFVTQFPFSFLPLPITTLKFRRVSSGIAQRRFGFLGTLFFWFFLGFSTCRNHIISCVSMKFVYWKQVNHHPYSSSFSSVHSSFNYKSRVRWVLDS